MGNFAARIRPGRELPDEPVARFDEQVGRFVDLGRMVQRLERLGEEPFEPDRSAVAGEPRFLAVTGDFVDAQRLGLGAVMFPQLRPRERLPLERFDHAKRRAVRLGREHRATGEIHADADDVGHVDLALLDRGFARDRETIEPILRMLQRIISGQLPAAGWKRVIDHAMRIIGRRLSGDATVFDVNDEHANRFGAIVEAECVAVIHFDRFCLVRLPSRQDNER